MPARLQTYNFLKRIPLHELFAADFLDSVDVAQPDRLQAEVYQVPEDAHIIDRMLYPYDDGKIAVSKGPELRHDTHRQQEFHVSLDGQQLFRYFRLEPRNVSADEGLPTMVCFMGHGKVAQIRRRSPNSNDAQRH